jgi:hypothetical protein
MFLPEWFGLAEKRSTVYIFCNVLCRHHVEFIVINTQKVHAQMHYIAEIQIFV